MAELKKPFVRGLALLSISAVAFATVPQAQAASIKVGGVCKKAGAKSTAAKNIKLICTKVGKKLVWKLVAAPVKVANGKPYKVSVINDLTGIQSSLSSPYLDGISTAFDLVNSQGGVKGHKIQYGTLNSQSDPTIGQAVVRSAISGKPVAIITAVASNTLAATFPLLDAAKLPTISLLTLGGPNSPWFYSAILTTNQLATSLYNSALALSGNTMAGKKVALVGIDSPATHATLDLIKQMVEGAGGTVTSVQFAAAGSPSFDGGAANIVSQKPDLVIVQHSAAGTILVAKALEVAGFNKLTVVNYSGSDDVSLTSIANPKVIGLRPYIYATPGTQLYGWADKFGHSKNVTNEGFVRGWLAAQMLLAGLNHCTATCPPAALISALDGLGSFTVPGNILPSGNTFTLNAAVHNPMSSVSLYRYDYINKTVGLVIAKVSAGLPGYPPAN